MKDRDGQNINGDGAVRKPRINYQSMTAKLTKRMAQDPKPDPPKHFEAAKPYHKYDIENIGMRQLYKDILRNQGVERS